VYFRYYRCDFVIPVTVEKPVDGATTMDHDHHLDIHYDTRVSNKFVVSQFIHNSLFNCFRLLHNGRILDDTLECWVVSGCVLSTQFSSRSHISSFGHVIQFTDLQMIDDSLLWKIIYTGAFVQLAWPTSRAPMPS